MIEISIKPGENYAHALARALEDAAKGTPAAPFAAHAAYELRTSRPVPPDCLHPDVCGLELRERMARLAETFPTLRGRAGVRPWDPSRFMREEKAAWTSPASREALRFVLSVWNTQNPTGKRFNASSAMASWDEQHREAFRAWAARPWWG